jgi:hypothetical protein
MIKVVAIHSREDNTTIALSDYWQTFGPGYFPPPNFQLVPRYGPDATWSNANPHPPPLRAVLQDPDVKLILGLSHSDTGIFEGDHNEQLFTVANVDNSVAGKIAHFCSCNPMPELGQAFINQGCLAFVGYNVDIIGTARDMRTVVKCDAQLDFYLAQGLSVADAMDRARDAFNAAIAAAPAPQKAEFAAVRDALCVVGNDGLKLSDL